MGLGLFVLQIVKEIYRGHITKTIPHLFCLMCGMVLCGSVALGIDGYVFEFLKIKWLYPTKVFYLVYYYLSLVSGYLFWVLLSIIRRRQLSKRVAEVFEACGLRNALGNVPKFISDVALDEVTRKLSITRNSMKEQSFKNLKDAMEGGLGIFIDEIKPNIEKSTVDITYSHFKMRERFDLDDTLKLGSTQFLVGITRSNVLVSDLRQVPHLLVAGQTGSGKSTFITQLVTHFYLNNKTWEFTLIDLKGGIESDTFEGLPRVEIFSSIEDTITRITDLSNVMTERLTLLKLNRCKDIDQFFEIPFNQRKATPALERHLKMSRQIIVVDEAAELFQAGVELNSTNVKIAKRNLNRIARLGRAAGMHLVLATQRPDSRVLDPQIKANLTGKLCFRMADDYSSISVIGNGRATDLPNISGRGIWSAGMEMVEVQTPYFQPDILGRQLAPYLKTKNSTELEITSLQKNDTLETKGSQIETGLHAIDSLIKR